MSDTRLSQLLEIHRAARSEDAERWHPVETSLGLTLPSSYKELVNRFGASSWLSFLHVLSPFESNPHLNLETAGTTILDAERHTRLESPALYPLPLFPEAGGILPWAITDNGDTLFFITAAAPDDWPTVIKGPRAPEFEVVFSPAPLIVHHFAAGTMRSMIVAEA